MLFRRAVRDSFGIIRSILRTTDVFTARHRRYQSALHVARLVFNSGIWGYLRFAASAVFSN
jgi:hypothetical protein